MRTLLAEDDAELGSYVRKSLSAEGHEVDLCATGDEALTAALGGRHELIILDRMLPGRDGLVHISKLGRGKRIAKVEDVCKVGDKLRVEIADIDNRGKISLIPVDEDGAGDAAPVPADAATASN